MTISSTGLGGLSLDELEVLRGDLLPAREEMRRVTKRKRIEDSFNEDSNNEDSNNEDSNNEDSN
ncbi:MAG TPA: hypothetical protein VGV93_07975, partial [Acidimicrobiales bacterium]|nr:hypothetical protein [Acidimicrobiales bacterium]